MIGPIFSKPPVPSTSVPERRTRVVWKIFRLFTMDKELRELVQEFYATYAAPRPHSRPDFLDPQIGPYEYIARSQSGPSL